MWDQGIVFGYLALLIIVGLRGGSKIHRVADFTASGKQCGAFVVFATLSASFIGGGYSSGNAAAAYESGIGTALALFGFGIGMILIGKFLVPGIVRFPNATTVGGIIGAAYGEKARRLTGLFAFLCCAGVVGAQMESIGLVFRSLLGVSKTAGILLGCSVVLLYTTFGGMESVLTADLIQFGLLAVGMPLLLLIAVTAGGGPCAVFSAIPKELLNPLNGMTLPAFLSLFFSMMLGEALTPPYMQRLLIGKNAHTTARGTILSGLFSLPFFLVTAAIGLTARALGLGGDAASVMPDLILRVLPVGLRGILMAAMTSIILSAADGFLNGAAVSLVCDTILPARPHIGDKAGLRLLRLVNFVTGAAAVAVALLVPNVFSLLLLAYSFWAPAILVPLAAALCGIKATERTFFTAVVTGIGVCLCWNHLLGQPLGIDGSPLGTLANAVVFFCAGFPSKFRLTKDKKRGIL